MSSVIMHLRSLMPERWILAPSQLLGALLSKAASRRAHMEPVATTLSEPVRVPYGAFKFKVQKPKGTACRIVASSDLMNWMPLVASLTTGEYLDSDAPKFSHRFYRAEMGAGTCSNAIGYASVSLPPGFSLIANPFVGTGTVGSLFKGWPDGTTLNKFDTLLVRLVENAVEAGKWTRPNQQLSPGEGAIFFNPTEDYKTHSFVGEVSDKPVTVPIPSGFSLRSSLLLKSGHLVDDLQFPISDGDAIHVFDRDRQKYVVHSFQSGTWRPGAPILGIGEAFWIAKTEAGNWAMRPQRQGHLSGHYAKIEII